MKRINPPQCLLDTWRKQYLYEQAKFIPSTHLRLDDLDGEFLSDNVTWKICGQMESGDIICQNLSNEQYFMWDKWKVSNLRKPEKHAIANTKNIKSTVTPIVKRILPIQLSIFTDIEEQSNDNDSDTEIEEDEIGSIDLDSIHVDDDEELI